MKIYRTMQPPVEDDPSKPKVTIYVPEPTEDIIQVDCGNVMFAGAPEAAVTVIDPSGDKWDTHKSLERVLTTIDKFLASDAEWLELLTPNGGEPVILRRALIEKVWLIQNAKAKLRKDFLPPAVPSGIKLVRGLPPAAVFSRPG